MEASSPSGNKKVGSTEKVEETENEAEQAIEDFSFIYWGNGLAIHMTKKHAHLEQLD